MSIPKHETVTPLNPSSFKPWEIFVITRKTYGFIGTYPFTYTIIFADGFIVRCCQEGFFFGKISQNELQKLYSMLNKHNFWGMQRYYKSRSIIYDEDHFSIIVKGKTLKTVTVPAHIHVDSFDFLWKYIDSIPDKPLGSTNNYWLEETIGFSWLCGYDISKIAVENYNTEQLLKTLRAIMEDFAYKNGKYRYQRYKNRINNHFLEYRQKYYGKNSEFFDPAPTHQHVFAKEFAGKNCFKEDLANLPFKKHKFFNSMNSSQALAISVFGTLRERKLLNLFGEICDEDLSNATLTFEKEVKFLKEPEPTSLDVWLESKDVFIGIECKFTEPGWGRCSYPKKKCDGIYNKYCPLSAKGIKYWDYIPQITEFQKNSKYDPCPIYKPYQYVRSLLATAFHPDTGKPIKNGKFILIYDERNPNWMRKSNAMKEALSIKTDLVDIYKLSWQGIACHLRSDKRLKDLVNWLSEKYGIFPLYSGMDRL